MKSLYLIMYTFNDIALDNIQIIDDILPYHFLDSVVRLNILNTFLNVLLIQQISEEIHQAIEKLPLIILKRKRICYKKEHFYKYI